ncbi:hypothetical protein SUGI_1073050 [Cryptomeria japonica]|uniref:uncharacterized protein LOC131077026 n=1 Tax=Cryptomeria japonica TaxID=3369 RepID=UPI0024146F77|nr:uncharacterized protein LOC131077026 [Cryptomeria japonica]GLJ50358.1 hypothetical protein SUGI_1073050 [Cryptomeria japonica]
MRDNASVFVNAVNLSVRQHLFSDIFSLFIQLSVLVNAAMAFRNDLLGKTRKLVKGFAITKPIWLKAMEEVPPVVFPRPAGKAPRIVLPEDKYIRKFYSKHPGSLTEEAFWFNGYDPPPARVFAWRVLELMNDGVIEEEATAIADMEYKADKQAKRQAYVRLKEIARLEGKKPPPNPYPSAIKEIQAEEKKYIHERFNSPDILNLVDKMKQQMQANMEQREKMRRR